MQKNCFLKKKNTGSKCICDTHIYCIFGCLNTIVKKQKLNVMHCMSHLTPLENLSKREMSLLQIETLPLYLSYQVVQSSFKHSVQTFMCGSQFHTHFLLSVAPLSKPNGTKARNYTIQSQRSRVLIGAFSFAVFELFQSISN